MNRIHAFAIVAFVLLAGLSDLCRAGYIYQNYELALQVENVNFSCPEQQLGGSARLDRRLGCEVTPGSRWRGTFALTDDPATLADGNYSLAVAGLQLVLGELVYRKDSSWVNGWNCLLSSVDPNCLDGFRDPFSEDVFNRSGPGFVVRNGAIVGIGGGLYGSADVPFVDFDYMFGWGAGRFRALTFGQQMAEGVYSIRAIPEPSSAVLVLLTLLLMAIQLKKRKHVSRRATQERAG
jgi:hypothetical protein